MKREESQIVLLAFVLLVMGLGKPGFSAKGASETRKLKNRAPTAMSSRNEIVIKGQARDLSNMVLLVRQERDRIEFGETRTNYHREIRDLGF